jgi:hypothetical protein
MQQMQASFLIFNLEELAMRCKEMLNIEPCPMKLGEGWGNNKGRRIPSWMGKFVTLVYHKVMCSFLVSIVYHCIL